MKINRRDGKAIIAIVIMLALIAGAYLFYSLKVKDKQSGEAVDGEVEESATEPGDVSVERANAIVQKTKKRLAGQKKALDDRLRKNLGN